MEGKFYVNEQYSKRKYLEILGVPVSVANNGLESTFLKPLEKTDVTIDPRLFDDCLCLHSKGQLKKVIIKLNRRKDTCRILLNGNKLKKLKPESVNFPWETNGFINESLCLYYKKVPSKCKGLWGAGYISVFWVIEGLLRIKLCEKNLCP